jgi:hypothetical protein
MEYWTNSYAQHKSLYRKTNSLGIILRGNKSLVKYIMRLGSKLSSFRLNLFFSFL